MMEFTVPKSALLPALKQAAAIAGRNSTMPMLTNVLVRATKKAIEVVATDLTVHMTTAIKCEVGYPGGLAMGAKALCGLIAAAPTDAIAFKQQDHQWAEIKSGKVKYRVAGLPDRDFPKPPTAPEEWTEIAAPMLAEMFDRTLFSTCHDETRFHLNGVLLESTGSKVRMVSTDGHRLSMVDRVLEFPTCKVIVPRKGATEILRAIDGQDAVELAIKGPYLFARSGPTTLAVKLIDAQFPPYEQVIQTLGKNPVATSINRADLLGALKRAKLMSSSTRGVRLTFGESLTVSCTNPDLGETSEDVECSETKALTTGVNPTYLIELLDAMDTECVRCECNGELHPLKWSPVGSDAYVGVIMPMRDP